MGESLFFTDIYRYNTLKVGITVPVEIKFAELVANFEAKVDTGASYCVFERIIGEKIGIDVESGSPLKISTAIGSFLAYGHYTEISVLNIKNYSLVYFAQEEAFSRNVLGRQGFLDRVKFGLDDYEGKLYLAANNADFQ